MSLRRMLIPLLVAAITIPIVLVLLLAVGRLLAALGDAAGAAALDRIALAGGILWGADLICLVILQGILSLEASPHDEGAAAGLAPEFDAPDE